MVVDITGEGVPRDQVEAARQRVEELERYMSEPPAGAVRVTLRHMNPGSKREYVADGDLRYDGRILAAHAAAASPLQAVDELTERLRRQLRRTVDEDVARRNEPSVIQKALDGIDQGLGNRPEASLKPPEEREIVHRRTYDDEPMGTVQAAANLLDLDLEFYLFRHVATGEDAVVYRRDDGRIGLIHPQGSELADQDLDIVVPEPNRYSGPLTLTQAREEMDVLNHRFLYFIDAEDGRGKVLYLRHDGDYGLVEPA
jgi:ribosome-associated translation inhibitor RaiA